MTPKQGAHSWEQRSKETPGPSRMLTNMSQGLLVCVGVVPLGGQRGEREPGLPRPMLHFPVNTKMKVNEGLESRMKAGKPCPWECRKLSLSRSKSLGASLPCPRQVPSAWVASPADSWQCKVIDKGHRPYSSRGRH